MTDINAVPDGPEADVREQQQEVAPSSTGGLDPAVVNTGLEVPEADAIEQAQEVPLPDDEELD